jgi:hypothetical protein
MQDLRDLRGKRVLREEHLEMARAFAIMVSNQVIFAVNSLSNTQGSAPWISNPFLKGVRKNPQ